MENKVSNIFFLKHSIPYDIKTEILSNVCGMMSAMFSVPLMFTYGTSPPVVRFKYLVLSGPSFHFVMLVAICFISNFSG